MRFRTLEIRWHDSKPISTCDFQPIGFKKARPALGQERNYASQAYRLATGGEDNHVRVSVMHGRVLGSMSQFCSILDVVVDGSSSHTTSSASRRSRCSYSSEC